MAWFGRPRTEQADDGGGPRAHRLEVVHGTLRSDLDEPARLPESFVELVARIGEQRVRYEQGEISRPELAALLAELVVTTPDGAQWTTGATSGQWYRRRPGRRWEQAVPPATDAPAQPTEDLLDRYFADGSSFVPPPPPPPPAAATTPSATDAADVDATVESELDAAPDDTVPAPTAAVTPTAPAVAPPGPAVTPPTPPPTTASAAVRIGEPPTTPPVSSAAALLGAPGGVPVMPSAPYPSVAQGPSALPLPEYVDTPPATVDGDGVWSSSWEAAGRSAGYDPAPADDGDGDDGYAKLLR